jgi:hypothetical protein
MRRPGGTRSWLGLGLGFVEGLCDLGKGVGDGLVVGAGDCQAMIDACLDLSDGLGIERALDPGSLGRDLME